jgi:tetratricopeptide (TPR) repeat protein
MNLGFHYSHYLYIAALGVAVLCGIDALAAPVVQTSTNAPHVQSHDSENFQKEDEPGGHDWQHGGHGNRPRGPGNRHAETLEECNRFLAESKDNVKLQMRAYDLRGHCYLRLGKYPEAIADLSKAIELHAKPTVEANVLNQEMARFRFSMKSARLFKARSEAYQKLGDEQSAHNDEKQYRLLKLMPEADRFMREGRDTEALAVLNEMLQLDPKDAWSYSTRGIIYSNQGNYKNALADFDKYVSIQPKSSAAFYYRAGAYFQLEQYKKAVDDLTVVVKINPAIVAMTPLKGVMRKGLKDHPRRMGRKRHGASQMAYGSRHDHPGVEHIAHDHEAHGVVAGQGHDRHEAHGVVAGQGHDGHEAHGAVAGRRHDGHEVHGVVEGQRHDGHEAHGELSGHRHDRYQAHGAHGFGGDKLKKGLQGKLRAQPVTMSDVYSLRALCYSKLASHQQAVADWSRAITAFSVKDGAENNETLARLIISRAKEYESVGLDQQAINDFVRGTKMSNDAAKDTDAFYELAQIYEKQSKSPQAIHEYDSAIAADPDFGEAYFARGQAYAAQKQFAKAVPDYTVAIEILPGNGRIYYYRSLAYRAMQKADNAERDLRESQRLEYNDLGAKPVVRTK